MYPERFLTSDPFFYIVTSKDGKPKVSGLLCREFMSICWLWKKRSKGTPLAYSHMVRLDSVGPGYLHLDLMVPTQTAAESPALNLPVIVKARRPLARDGPVICLAIRER